MNKQGSLTSSWVFRLIVINVIIYLLQQHFAPMYGSVPNPVTGNPMRQISVLSSIFGITPYFILNEGYVWQFVTYMFLHGSFVHILFNMYALLMFGIAIEASWGSKEFLLYYFFTGIGAGITIFIVNGFIFGGALEGIPTIGASGAIFGVLLAFGILFPDVELLLFFILPIKARFFVIGYGALTLFLLIEQNPNDPVSHAGHFGGLLFGIIYFVFIRRRLSLNKNKAASSFTILKQAKEMPPETNSQEEEDNITVLINIIKKIKHSGVDSLTDDELQKVKYIEIMHRDSANICTEDDFDSGDDYCLNCENFEACIARELSKYIKFDKE